MSTVDERAVEVYNYLANRQDQRFTMGQLCRALEMQPGAKTTAAIRRARDIAASNGLHLPPAVPANGFTYTVTGDGVEALHPAIHMGRIAAGVRRREQVGYDFAEANSGSMPEQMRAAVVAHQKAVRETQRYMDAMDQLVLDLVEQLKAIGR